MKIWTIAKFYRNATVWTAEATTGQRIATSTVNPPKELSLRARYDEIAIWMRDLHRMEMPLPFDEKGQVGRAVAPKAAEARIFAKPADPRQTQHIGRMVHSPPPHPSQIKCR